MEYLRGDAEATTFVNRKGLVIAKDKDVLLLWDGSNAGEFLRAKYGVVSSTAALVEATAIDRDYLFWISKAIEPVLRMYTNGMGIPHVDGDFLRNLRLLLPVPSIQREIADYLDRETARIDALVAEKESMLALLEEKRTALISRAVTRGLDSSATLKPSGLDWLGSTPSHWDVMPIKYVAFVGNGSTPAVDNEDFWDEEGFPWLNSSVVNADYVREASRRVTAKALKDCHLPIISPPAVLVGITGQGKTRGMAAVLMIEATINQHLAFLKPRDKRIKAEYLRYVLLRAYSYLRSDSEGSGSTKGAITCEQLASFRIPLPPEEEQVHIVRQIQESERIMERVQQELEHSVRLLKERRAALITATVTGQIPMKGMAA
jgi:type I restriction enzyme S subunit